MGLDGWLGRILGGFGIFLILEFRRAQMGVRIKTKWYLYC